MRKTILTAVTVLLVSIAATMALAAVDSTGSKTDSTSTSTSNDDSKSKTRTDTKTTDRGDKKDRTTQSGIKRSTAKSLQKSLDKVNQTSLQKELSIVPLFAGAYSRLPKYNWLLKVGINKILKEPISTPDGRIELTYQQNLSALAASQGSADDLIKKDLVIGIMNELQILGFTIRDNVKSVPLETFGMADWYEIADLVAKNSPLSPAKYDTSGECSFINEFTTIQCGECMLSVKRTQGLPELICSGLPVFGQTSAGGLSMKASINDSFSVKDAESLSQTDEAFKGITDSFSVYLSHSAANSDAVAAMRAKKITFQRAAAEDKRVGLAIKAVHQEQNAAGVLGFLGVK